MGGEGGVEAGSREVGGWEVAGGKSENRPRSLQIEWIDRCRSNRFGHGMLKVFSQRLEE